MSTDVYRCLQMSPDVSRCLQMMYLDNRSVFSRINITENPFNKWNKRDVEIERDMSKNRAYDLKSEALPQFGEGSEYRAREKEIARKMTLGHRIQKFDIDAQSWKLTLSDFEKEGKGGKAAKKKPRKFTGNREGDVTQNSMYFVMHQKEGQIFEAFKIEVRVYLKWILL